LRVLAVLLNPVLPKACRTLWTSLGAETTLGPLAAQRTSEVARWDQLAAGNPVTKCQALFPRLED
jgi:methionyl-tRNA synthetase